MLLTSSLPHAFGLHISDRALKLALVCPKLRLWSKTPPRMGVAASRPLPEGIIINGDIKKPELLIAELRELLKHDNFKKIGENIGVIANLPESKTFLKYASLSDKKEEEIDEHIQKIIKNEIPFPKEEMYIDVQIFKNREDFASALIAAAPKTIVDEYIAVLEKLGLVIYGLEIESAATARAVLPVSDDGLLQKTEIIIDIGAERTSVIFTTGGLPRLTVLVPFSGNLLTKTIAENLNMTFEKAEEVKLRCGLDVKKCEGTLRDILKDATQEFAGQLKAAIKFYHAQFLDAPKVTAAHLSGGGAYLLKLDSIISRDLRIKARRANILSNVSFRPSSNADDLLHYATAIGLSLRGALSPFPNHE